MNRFRPSNLHTMLLLLLRRVLHDPSLLLPLIILWIALWRFHRLYMIQIQVKLIGVGPLGNTPHVEPAHAHAKAHRHLHASKAATPKISRPESGVLTPEPH